MRRYLATEWLIGACRQDSADITLGKAAARPRDDVLSIKAGAQAQENRRGGK